MKNLLSTVSLSAALSLCCATAMGLRTQGQSQVVDGENKVNRKPVESGAAKPNIHDMFDQFESTRFLNHDVPATADWAQVPWTSAVSSIQRFGESYWIGVGADSEFWVAEQRNLTVATPTPSVFAKIQMPAALNQTYNYSNPSPMLNQWVMESFNDLMVCRLPNFAAGFDTAICAQVYLKRLGQLESMSVFHVENITSSASTGGRGFPLRQMAIEYAIDAHQPPWDAIRHPKNIYFASEGGLNYVPFEGFFATGTSLTTPVVTAQPVLLTNTTGGRHNNTNVTSVWCFPQDLFESVFNTSARPDAWHGGQCYVGTANQVCLHNVCPPNLVHRVLDGRETYFYRTPGIIDRLPNGITYDGGRNAVHMGNDKCLNILYANDSLWRVDGKTGGLPMNKIKSVSGGYGYFGGVDIWYGTEQGVNVMLPDGNWRYFYGPRWLPVPQGAENKVKGNYVVAMAAGGGEYEGVALVATKTGLSIIRKTQWSMEAKAAEFQKQHDKYHDRVGLSTNVYLAEFGNLSSWYAKPTANDGLWSSIYLHGQAFRFAAETNATLKAEAKKNAKKTFAGMKMLFTVTGIKGYPARGFKQSTSSPGRGWNKSPTMPGYWYNSQTSSDEITGHMSAYPIYHDLVCETQAEKDEAKEVIANLVSHIVDHNNDLIGKDGKPTLWGRWSNHGVNNDPFYYDGRGLNSLEYMMILSGGYHVTRNETYASVFMDLVENHHYGENSIHSKITQVSDVNYSDDELNFCAYLGLLWTSNVLPGSQVDHSTTSPSKLFAKVQYDVLISIQRTFHYKQVYGERSNWWNSVYVGYMKTLKPGGLSASEEEFLMGAKTGAVFSFQTWANSWITWPIDNSQRLDIVVNPHTEDVTAMESILPYDETPLLLWNGSPYSLTGGGGHQLMDPSAWLTPYWTARYFGLFNTTK